MNLIIHKNHAILINLTPDFDFLLQLSPSLISNLTICFKIILELQIFSLLAKSNQFKPFSQFPLQFKPLIVTQKFSNFIFGCEAQLLA